MCGVLGFSGNLTPETKQLVKNLIQQSRIRGLHSSGISVLYDNILKTDIEILGVEEIFNVIDSLPLGHISLIAHTRYSTSDLEFNQPIYNEFLSIVHNGVITQMSPENWEDFYGYKCKGRNDSELILKCIENGGVPLMEFKDSSMAVIELHNNGEILFYRNVHRPLWYIIDSGNLFVASTRDIFIRAFNSLRVKVEKCNPNFIYKLTQGVLTKNPIGIDSVDLQIDTENSKFYLKNRRYVGLS